MKNKDEKEDLYNIEFYKSLSGIEAFKERMQGRLPIIDIAGHPFFVEVRFGLLRPKDYFQSRGLDMNNGGYFDEKENRHLFYYHKRNKCEAIIKPNLVKFPKNVVMIKVPDFYTLDPVMMARLEGKQPDAYLEKYPLIMYRRAEVIPLQKTHLAEVLEQNLAIECKKILKPRVIRSSSKNNGRGL